MDRTSYSLQGSAARSAAVMGLANMHVKCIKQCHNVILAMHQASVHACMTKLHITHMQAQTHLASHLKPCWGWLLEAHGQACTSVAYDQVHRPPCRPIRRHALAHTLVYRTCALIRVMVAVQGEVHLQALQYTQPCHYDMLLSQSCLRTVVPATLLASCSSCMLDCQRHTDTPRTRT